MLKRFGRDIAVYGGVDLLFKLAQFALLPVYTRHLSVPEFGVLALLQVSMFLVAAVANVGANYSVQRFYFDPSIPPSRRPVLVSTGLAQLSATTIIVVSAVALIAYPAREILNQDFGISWVLLIVALATVFPDQLAGYALDTSRLQFSPLRFSIIAFVKHVVGLIIGVWLLLAEGWGLIGLFVGNLVGSSLAVPIGLWLVRQDLVGRLDLAYTKILLRFGAPFIVTAAGYWAFSSLDRWLLARFANGVEVGFFGLALKLASVIALVVTAFHQAWVPLAMRLVAEDSDHPRLISRLADVWLLTLGLMALGLALFSADILAIVSPPDYWPAAPVLAIGGAATAMSGTTQITSLGITVAKRTGLIATGAWLTAGVNVGANVLLIPEFGATGAAIALMISFSFLTTYYLIWSQRLYPFPFHKGRFLFAMALMVTAAITPSIPMGAPLTFLSIGIKVAILVSGLGASLALGLLDFRLLRNVLLRSRSGNG
jgi:O-antigen/teichoic acid export membrane protein